MLSMARKCVMVKVGGQAKKKLKRGIYKFCGQCTALLNSLFRIGGVEIMTSVVAVSSLT
jgi:hypothetical protein